jgi:hypothetical protein
MIIIKTYQGTLGCFVVQWLQTSFAPAKVLWHAESTACFSTLWSDNHDVKSDLCMHALHWPTHVPPTKASVDQFIAVRTYCSA